MANPETNEMKRVVLYMTTEDYEALKRQAQARDVIVANSHIPSVSAYVRLIAREGFRVSLWPDLPKVPGWGVWEHSFLRVVK